MDKAALLALLLSGGAATHDVAWFDPPSKAEQQAERERCYTSRICRAVIDDRPPILFRALNDEPECKQHADNAERALEALGVPRSSMRFAYGELALPGERGEKHAMLFVTLDGAEWAVDNGAHGGCPERVCRSDEALRGLQYVLYRSVGEAQDILAYDKSR